jgi:hypothetical protein
MYAEENVVHYAVNRAYWGDAGEWRLIEHPERLPLTYRCTPSSGDP